MTRTHIPLAAAAAILAVGVAVLVAPVPGRSEPPFALKSVSVDLPDDGAQFPGADADAINGNCLACHSAGMVLNQPDLPAATWQAEVDKMIHTYKAPVDEADVPAIVAYLTRLKGAK